MDHMQLRLFFLIVLALITACRPTPAVELASAPAATETPELAIDYATLSEEELAILIVTALAQAESTSVIARTVTVRAIRDGTITPDEIDQSLAFLYLARTAITQADEGIDAYNELYSEIAGDSIYLLLFIAQDLDVLAAATDSAINILEQRSAGVADQLNRALAVAEATDLQDKARDWQAQSRSQISARQKFYANIQPQSGQVAYNRVEAFAQAHDFIEALKTAFEDDKLSSDELTLISQLAATAEASLYNTGDWQVMDFARHIDARADHAARGEWPQARRGLDELARLLPARPRP
jgi:hypothetical protein